MTHATSGQTLPEPLAVYDHASSCWRTFGGMFPSDSMPSLATFPASGMTRGGELYELPTPEHPTDEPECSSVLPTPTRRGYRTGYQAGGSPPNRRGSAPLNDAVAHLLPTPEAKLSDSGPDYARANREGSGGDDLTTTVHRFLLPTMTDVRPSSSTEPTPGPSVCAPSALLPTPAVNDMGAGKTPEDWDDWTDRMQERHGNGNGHGKSLAIEALRLLPTPVRGDGAGGRTMTFGKPEGTLAGLMKHLGHGEPMSPPSDDGND